MNIKTWRERLSGVSGLNLEPGTIEQAMEAEIDELRAALKAQPVQPAPLTDDQIFEAAEPFGAFEYGDAQGHKRIVFARAIEARVRTGGAG
jgi:hypothetical protein